MLVWLFDHDVLLLSYLYLLSFAHDFVEVLIVSNSASINSMSVNQFDDEN